MRLKFTIIFHFAVLISSDILQGPKPTFSIAVLELDKEED